MTTDDLQFAIGTWGNETFPSATPDSIVVHLGREVVELSESHAPEEGADCLLLLFHHAHKCGYDLLAEARKKFEINRDRKWGKADEHGVVEHVH